MAAGVPEGYDAFLLAAIAGRLRPLPRFSKPSCISRVTASGSRWEPARVLCANAEVTAFPAWDCVPYDRVSPDSDIEARRITALARLAHAKGGKPAIIVLTTVNAVLSVCPRSNRSGRPQRG